MAEVHVCEHIEAVSLGPNDRMAIVVPEDAPDDFVQEVGEWTRKWWPGRVVVLQEPLRIVAMAQSDDINTEAANQ